jgi:hypothetical protein
MIMIKVPSSGRVLFGTGFWVPDGGWHVSLSSVKKVPLKPVAWHAIGEPLDMHRSWMAVWWTEKHYGLLKVKNLETWMALFQVTWKTKPWA